MHLNRVAAGAAATLAVGFIAACAADPTTGPQIRPEARPSRAVSAPVPAGSKTCPNTGSGWYKIDNGSGSAPTGTNPTGWGSFTYSGKTVNVTLNAGYTLTLCVKSGVRVNDGNAVLYTITPEFAAGEPVVQRVTIVQDISHVSWRVQGPPTVELQDLVVTKSADGTYDRTVTWTLNKTINGWTDKSAPYTGTPGQSFPITWNIKTNKSETLDNYRVSGAVFITNPNNVAITVRVADVLKTGTPGNYVNATNPTVTVSCPGGSDEASVPAGGTISCSYDVARGGDDVTLNEATVTVVNPPTGLQTTSYIATDPVEWEEELIGDDSGILTDNRFPTTGEGSFYQVLTSLGEGEFTLRENFRCSSNADDYTGPGNTQTVTAVNTATLDLDGELDKTSSATFSLTCNGFAGETATGDNLPWSAVRGAPSNWFMYTRWDELNGTRSFTAPRTEVNLIAGQHFDIGTITGANGDRRTITITLAAGARFQDVADNVKIQPLASCDPRELSYIQPGQYSVKARAAAGATSIPVPVPSTVRVNRTDVPAVCYAIHVDALRFLSPAP